MNICLLEPVMCICLKFIHDFYIENFYLKILKDEEQRTDYDYMLDHPGKCQRTFNFKSDKENR